MTLAAERGRRRSPIRTVTAALALLVVAPLAAGCGGHHRSALPPGEILGPGNVAYRWPPPAVVQPTSTGQFCGVLIDVYEHLKTAQATNSVAAKSEIVQGYITYAPALVSAAPASIADPVKTYVTTIATFLQQLLSSGFNLLKISPTELRSVGAAPVGAAEKVLTNFATQQCHYDLSANSTPFG